MPHNCGCASIEVCGCGRWAASARALRPALLEPADMTGGPSLLSSTTAPCCLTSWVMRVLLRRTRSIWKHRSAQPSIFVPRLFLCFLLFRDCTQRPVLHLGVPARRPCPEQPQHARSIDRSNRSIFRRCRTSHAARQPPDPTQFSDSLPSNPTPPSAVESTHTTHPAIHIHRIEQCGSHDRPGPGC